MTYFAGINPTRRFSGDWGFKNILSIRYQEKYSQAKKNITYRKARCDVLGHKAVLGHIELG